jgi:ribosomal protein S17E
MKNGKTTETINESIENSMKWFQESAAAMTQTFDKQIEFAKNIYGKALETSLDGSKGKLGETHGITEMFAKNMETFTKFGQNAMETMMNFSKQNSSPFFTKQASDSLLSAYREQMETIQSLTEKQFEFFRTELNSMKTLMTPLMEKSKTDLDANFEASKKALKTITEMFETRMHDSAEANKELLAELDSHMNKLVTSNNKIWTELMHQSKEEAAHEEKTAHTSKTAVQEPAKKAHASSKH